MPQRIDHLIEFWNPILRRAFEESVQNLRSAAQLDLIARMLEAGDVDGALRAVGLDPISFRPFDRALTSAFEAGGDATTRAFPTIRTTDGFRVNFGFDVRNPLAEQWLRLHSSRQITEIVDDQRTMIQSFLRAGMEAGNNPRTVALDLVGRVGPDGARVGGVLGLTSSQEQWVANYAAELASDNPAAALLRTMRDRRFDRAVLKAVNSGEAIPAALRTKMIMAYRNRALRYRATAIARTEAMAALHSAQKLAVNQALETGGINRGDVTRVWHATNDERVRDIHEVMDGQEVAMGEMFIDGDGNSLEFPGDPLAPPETTINCRCWVEVKVDFLAGLM